MSKNDLNIMLTEKFNDYKETNEPKDEIIINYKNNITEDVKLNSKLNNNKKKRYKTKCAII